MPSEERVMRAREVGSRLLQDRVWAEARERFLNDATQQDFENHLIRVAGEHAAMLAFSDEGSGIGELDRTTIAVAIERADVQKVPDGYADGVTGMPAIKHDEVSDWSAWLADAVIAAFTAAKGVTSLQKAQRTPDERFAEDLGELLSAIDAWIADGTPETEQGILDARAALSQSS